MNELIERVQHQLDNNHPVEKEDIQKMINLLQGDTIEIGSYEYFLSINPLPKVEQDGH